jgi:hypothetical protein
MTGRRTSAGLVLGAVVCAAALLPSCSATDAAAAPLTVGADGSATYGNVLVDGPARVDDASGACAVTANDLTVPSAPAARRDGPAPEPRPRIADLPPVVGAVLCSREQGARPDGTTGTVVVRRTVTGGLPRLLETLGRGDARSGGSGACAAYADLEPGLWLLDADGRAARPRYPLDVCGHVKKDVRQALDALTATPDPAVPADGTAARA